MKPYLLLAVSLLAVFLDAATPVIKERKGGQPVIALEAVPWDFELPRGFFINRQLSKDYRSHMRPSLTGEVHLRKHREDYALHIKNFPGSGVEPFDNSAWTITMDIYQGELGQCLDRYLNKAEEYDGANPSKRALKIHGHSAYRIRSKGRVTDQHGLILALAGGGCLVFDAPPNKLERSVSEDASRAIDHISKTLMPRGMQSKKPRAKAVEWSKVPERHMFDGLESKGGAKRGFRSAF